MIQNITLLVQALTAFIYQTYTTVTERNNYTQQEEQHTWHMGR